MKNHISILLSLSLLTATVTGCISTQAVPPPHMSARDGIAVTDNQTGSPPEETDRGDLLPEPAAEADRGMSSVQETVKHVPSAAPFGAPPSVPQPPVPSASGDKIALNFDNADIYEVINALSDFLGINYIIDPSVKGKVNIHTSTEIDRSQLLPILESIFEMNNIALVEFGDIYKILPVKEAKTEIIDINIGRKLPGIFSYDKVIIQIVPLKYVPAGDIEKVLKRFIGKSGDIVNYKDGNILIIVESAANIRKLLQLINIIDVDTFAHTGIRFFKVKNAGVKDVAKELESIFTSMGISKSSKDGIGLTFIPIERVSCILAVSSIPGIFEKVENWLNVLDSVDMDAEEQVFIYFVENGKASEIADVLTKIYGEGQSTKSTRKQPTTRTRTKKTAAKTQSAVSGTLEGEIKIVTDETTNSIIVRATPHDYSVIKATIDKLDIIPKQVLIEVLIAEVTLKGDTEFGIEWSLLGDSATVGGYKGTDQAGLNFGMTREGGFTYNFDSNRLQVFLRAQASKNKLNILSSPHILAADNKEARIEVGEEVPIVTSEYVPQDVEVSTSTSRSIEYRSTGVILSVTPRINEKGLVAMDITQEVSEAQEVVAGGIQSPVISNRKAETSLVVQHDQTIIIGGLIKDQSGQTISSVPLLASIPVLRYFFSDTQGSSNKTELMIMITPHVVNNIDEAEITSQEFKQKLHEVKKLIERGRRKWLGDYR